MTVKQFRDTELTNVGFSVSNKAAIGKTQFSTTRAVSTDVDLSGYKIDDLKNLTSLPNEINSGIITDYDMQGNSVSAIKINFNNSNFKDGYVVRAVGMYAKENGSDKEFLHSITVSDSPVYIPAVSGNVYDGFYFTMAIFSGSNKNISIKIADETNATVKYVDDAVSGLSKDVLEKIDDLNKKATDNANSIESKADKKDLETVSDKLSFITGEAKGYANVIDHTKPISEVRKTGVYRSDIQYNDYKDTPDGNNNFTLLVNYDGYFLHQCYVSENVWIRDENRGFKWRKIAMDTDINSLIDKIDYLSSKGMVYRGNITTGDDFNNFTKLGFYRVDLNGLNDNMPPNSGNSRGLLINTNADGYLKQEFFDLNFIRSCIRYSRDNIWSNWQQLATNDYVDQNIRQVNANINGVQNQVYDVDNHSFKRYDGWISGYVNSLDDLLKLPSGFSQIGNAPFLPDGSSKWGMINKYTLNDVFVTYFDQYNGSIWTITKVGGTWSPWRKIGGG